jgi:hypothetical protein
MKIKLLLIVVIGVMSVGLPSMAQDVPPRLSMWVSVPMETG